MDQKPFDNDNDLRAGDQPREDERIMAAMDGLQGQWMETRAELCAWRTVPPA